MNEYLWTFPEILKAVEGAGPVTGGVFGIAIDSREAYPGDLFIALPGTNSDGHDFVKSAFARGVNAAVVSKTPKGVSEADPRLVKVDDTYKALLKLAAVARKRSAATIIAVTGTAGKTGTKDALAEALGMKAETHASIKSFNNHVGAPLSLARLPRDAAFGVFEVGMNKPGEISPLSKLIRPHVALVTTVGGGHAAAFKNEAAIAREKAAIFDGLEKDGVAVLNADNPHFAALKKFAKTKGAAVKTFSAADHKADACLLQEALHARCSCLTARIGDTAITYKISVPGRHWVANSLGILLAVEAAGGDLGLAGLALANLKPQAGRGAVYQVEGPRGAFEVVDESYNANPLSMTAALETFAKFEPAGERGRKVAVLADMEELGDTAEKAHFGLADKIKAAGITVLYVKGPGMTALGGSLKGTCKVFTFKDNAGIFRKLEQDIAKGDVVMVKGSRAARLDEVVDQLLATAVETEASGWGRAAAG